MLTYTTYNIHSQEINTNKNLMGKGVNPTFSIRGVDKPLSQ